MKLPSLKEAAPGSSVGHEFPRAEKLTEEQYVIEIARSVPVSNLSGWHHALTAVLGQERGREWYLKIREEISVQAALSVYCSPDEAFRGVYLIATAFRAHGMDVAGAKEAIRSFGFIIRKT